MPSWSSSDDEFSTMKPESQMKIAVLVKEVPDTWGDRRIDPVTKRVDRNGDVVIDEINEKAVEAALLVK